MSTLLQGGHPKIGDLVRRGRRHSRDERADLWWSFFSIVDRLKPSAVLFENVPDFARAQGGALLTSLISELRSRSYGVTVDVLDAWRYRVPQHRSRLFVVAFAGNRGFEWPRPRGRRPTVWQAHRRPSGGCARHEGGGAALSRPAALGDRQMGSTWAEGPRVPASSAIM